MSPIRGGRHRRLVRAGETYTADDEAELEPGPADAIEPPEAEQVGPDEHEGGPDDGGH
jgi:hypothetical protein